VEEEGVEELQIERQVVAEEVVFFASETLPLLLVTQFLFKSVSEEMEDPVVTLVRKVVILHLGRM
jgi:hypothetical protein